MEDTKINPWLSIWMCPRETIDYVISHYGNRFVLMLAGFSGLSEGLNTAANRGLGDQYDLATVFIFASLLGPVGGIAGLFVFGFLVRITGKWLGGHANAQEIRAALAWPSVIIMWSLLLWIPYLAIFGEDMFSFYGPEDSLILLILSTIESILLVWWFVAMCMCLGQVQGFSSWKALGSIVLTSLVVVAPVFVLLVI